MLKIEQILPYIKAINIKQDKSLLHEFYADSVKIAESIAEVFSDEYPSYLEKSRPREKEEAKKYRKEIYENLWASIPTEVSDEIDKIFQSEDFSITYPLVEGVNPDENLDVYVESQLPIWGSLKTWLRDEGKRQYLVDPNAVIAVFDKDPLKSETEFFTPTVTVIPSKNVIEFLKGEFAVLLSTKKSDVTLSNGQIAKNTGDIFFFFDKDSYTIAKQTAYRETEDGTAIRSFDIVGLTQGEDGTTSFEPVMTNGIWSCFKIGSIAKKRTEDGDELFQSVLTAALPYIRQAQARYSDLQVEYNFHVNSREWMYNFSDCRHCKGTGKVTKTETYGNIILKPGDYCPHCGGTGMQPVTSTDTIIVRPSKSAIGDSVAYPPVPPGGTLVRSIEPARELVLEIKRLEEKALQSIKLCLDTAGLNQSGKAKELDREGGNTKLRGIATHLLDVVYMNTAKAIAYQRYGFRYDVEAVTAMLPSVQVPTNMNLLDLGYLQEKLTEAKAEGLGSVIVGKFKKQLAARMLGENSPAIEYEELIALHDPMYGQSTEQKLIKYGGGVGSTMMTITYEDYIISQQIEGFLSKALIEYPEFKTLEYEQQRDILKGYAQVVIDANKGASIYDREAMGTLNAPLDLRNFNSQI